MLTNIIIFIFYVHECSYYVQESTLSHWSRLSGTSEAIDIRKSMLSNILTTNSSFEFSSASCCEATMPTAPWKTESQVKPVELVAYHK